MQILAKHAEKGTPAPRAALREVTESLVTVLTEDDGAAQTVDCVKAIYTLHSADPDVLSTAQATLLLPFLKSARTVDEQQTMEFLLRIFRTAVESRPNMGTQFGRNLQETLSGMVNKPPPALSSIQEVVACFCAVVRGQTDEYDGMIRTFKLSLCE